MRSRRDRTKARLGWSFFTRVPGAAFSGSRAWSLLIVYEDRYNREGRAWVPSDSLQREPVELVVPPTLGEFVFIAPRELWSSSVGRFAPVTLCGPHRLHARKDIGDGPLSQYADGVEVTGWTNDPVPKAEPITCEPWREIRTGDAQTADLRGFLRLDDPALTQGFEAILRSGKTLYVAKGTEHGAVCKQLEVRRTRYGFELRSPPVQWSEDRKYIPILTVRRERDGLTFSLSDSGQAISASGQRFDVQSRCGQSLLRVAAITDHEIRASYVLNSDGLSDVRDEEPLEPFAVAPSSTVGWYRDLKTCEAAVAPVNEFVHNEGRSEGMARSSGVMSSASGC